MSINNFDIDGASEECAASESVKPMTVMVIVANNIPEQTLEVAVGREHDLLKTTLRLPYQVTLHLIPNRLMYAFSCHDCILVLMHSIH